MNLKDKIYEMNKKEINKIDFDIHYEKYSMN